MRFHLIDRIAEVSPGHSLRAVKNLTLGEEYLADHFPTFPVMPGVLMLQTLVEAGAWLLRISEDYAHSVIVLREVRNIKYGSFMEPGKRMQVHVELADRQPGLATFKGKGEADGATCVNARIVLATYNLADPAQDRRIIDDLKEQARLLCDLPGGVTAQRGA
jgi:3-hydroxyacyl-[acyl-carrier-protein] dehydratase